MDKKLESGITTTKPEPITPENIKIISDDELRKQITWWYSQWSKVRNNFVS